MTNQPIETHKFDPSDCEKITSWLAQNDPDALPSELQAIALTPIQQNIGRVVVLLANLICDFEPRASLLQRCKGEGDAPVVFTSEERALFEKLQREYHAQHFTYLTSKGSDTKAAAKDPTIFTLTLGMIMEKESEGLAIKSVFVNYLKRKAEESERELLLELELESASMSAKKGKKKNKQQRKKEKTLPQKENLPDGNLLAVSVDKREGLKENFPDRKPRGDDNNKEGHNGESCLREAEMGTLDEADTETKKRVRFQKQSACKENLGIREGNTVTKGILRKELSVDVPKSNDILAHMMVPLKIDYEDRVSETALPRPNETLDLSTNEISQSIVPTMSPTKMEDGDNPEVSLLVSEIESLKAENAQLRREVSSAGQKLTEAVQRVQLKAYIAETARDSAQERAALLEALLLEVLDGKIAGNELGKVLSCLQQQASSPTAASSLDLLLEKLPKDTLVRLNSNVEQTNSLQGELQSYQGILSRLRQGGGNDK